MVPFFLTKCYQWESNISQEEELIRCTCHAPKHISTSAYIISLFQSLFIYALTLRTSHETDQIQVCLMLILWSKCVNACEDVTEAFI